MMRMTGLARPSSVVLTFALALSGALSGALLSAQEPVRPPASLLIHNVTLIAFFAWVGLGADGLSSSCYGPEEAFLSLGSHLHLALYLAIAVIGTVFLLSASYSQIIEHFPTGGGGYLVATKLLGPVPGVVSGCALLVDYILTIAISIKELCAR